MLTPASPKHKCKQYDNIEHMLLTQQQTTSTVNFPLFVSEHWIILPKLLHTKQRFRDFLAFILIGLLFENHVA